MFHCLAWAQSLANNAATDAVPVQDGIITVQNSHFVPQNDIFMHWACFMAADANRVRIITPSVRQITTPFLRPVEKNLTPGSRPGVADYRRNPLRFRGLEELQAELFQNGAGAENAALLMGISDGPILNVPVGDVYTMRGTATTAAVANTWTLLSVTWQDTLPAGTYSLLGLETVSATGKGSRLIFEDQAWRPGSISMSANGNFTHPMFRNGGLGVWGQFNANRMPGVEVLCNTTDNSHEIYIDFVRVR